MDSDTDDAAVSKGRTRTATPSKPRQQAALSAHARLAAAAAGAGPAGRKHEPPSTESAGSKYERGLSDAAALDPDLWGWNQ